VLCAFTYLRQPAIFAAFRIAVFDNIAFRRLQKKYEYIILAMPFACRENRLAFIVLSVLSYGSDEQVVFLIESTYLREWEFKFCQS
jgi:hypothetical protein